MGQHPIPPTKNKTNLQDSQEKLLPGALPGLELQAILQSPGAARERIRVDLGRQLAAAILGTDLDLVDGRDGPQLVDRESGLPVIFDAGQLRRVLPGGELGGELPPRAAAFASLLLRTSQDRNHLAGILTHKERDGQAESFLGGMCAMKWSLRLDPNWMTALRARSRSKARERIRAMLVQLPKKEKRLRERKDASGRKSSARLFDVLLTLTQPRRPGAKTLDQLQVFNLAFRGLTRSDLWTANVHAGVKGVEDKLDADGPHVHGHILLTTRYLPWWKIQREWWIQLNFAWKRIYGESMELMPGGLPMTDIRLVKQKMPAGRELPGHIGIEAALDEVSKYITKTADLVAPGPDGRRISSQTLLEQCEIERWPRMFELLGACREAGAERPSTLVHTSCISVARSVRDALTYSREPEEGELPPAPMSCREGERDEIQWVWNWEKREYQAKQKARPPTWRQLMDQLPFPDWLHLMMGRAEAGFKFRLKWILEHNPTCFLVDLSGKCVAKQEPSWEAGV